MASILALGEGGQSSDAWGVPVATVDFSTSVALDVGTLFELECARVRQELSTMLDAGQLIIEQKDLAGRRVRFYVREALRSGQVLQFPLTPHQIVPNRVPEPVWPQRGLGSAHRQSAAE